jgi:hypothetical protein
MTVSNSLDAQADSIIEDFTLDQLRELVAAVSAGKEIGSLQNKNRAQIIELLGRFGDRRKKTLAAHRLEAITPYKHLYLYSLLDTHSYESLATTFRREFPTLVDGFSPLPRDSASLHLQLCLLDEQQNRIFLKFAHQVSSWVTVNTSADQRIQKLIKKRHPVVATIYVTLSLVVISFPGFTQGGVSYKERANYAGIARDVERLFTELTKLELRGFQAKSAIEKLLADPDAQVSDVKRSIRPKAGGKITVDSWEDSSGLAHYISKYLEEGNVTVNAGDVRELLQSGADDDIWLMWKKLDLLTRIAFQQSVPEILVVWRGAGPDLSKSELALQSLVSHLINPTPNETLAAAEEIDKTDIGGIITPGFLAQRFNMTTDEALRVLTNAASRRLLEVRFRVRTDALIEDFENRWRNTLVEFPDQVTDEHGNILDLKDTSHIEIAFERVT